jgi:hypothetical protein
LPVRLDVFGYSHQSDLGLHTHDEPARYLLPDNDRKIFDYQAADHQ